MKKMAFITFLTLLLLIPQRAHAQATSLGIYPPVSQITAREGAIISLPITLVSASDELISVSLSLRGFEPGPNNTAPPTYYPESQTPEKLTTLLKTIEFQEDNQPIKSIQLYPNESKTITALIPITTNTPEEYIFAIIASSIKAKEEVLTTQLRVQPSVASLVFLSVNPKEGKQISISDFTTSFFHTGTPVHFDLKALNPSAHATSVSGSVAVYDMFGRRSYTLDIQPQIIPANTSRTLKEGPSGTGELEMSKGFMFGFYTAEASLSYENGSVVKKQTRFIVLPVIILFFITAVLFVILGVLLRVIKKLNLKEA